MGEKRCVRIRTEPDLSGEDTGRINATTWPLLEDTSSYPFGREAVGLHSNKPIDRAAVAGNFDNVFFGTSHERGETKAKPGTGAAEAVRGGTRVIDLKVSHTGV